MMIASHQPEYLPYIGLCYKAMSCDIFMFLDHVQYCKGQFQNRNKIRINHGESGWIWLTVPVIIEGRSTQRINEAEINNVVNWNEKHFKLIGADYRGTPFFQDYISVLENIYRQKWEKIAPFNEAITEAIFKILGINVKIVKSSDYPIEGHKTDMLIDICRKTGASDYLSGQGGKNYVEEDKFHAANLGHHYLEFNHPVYPQRFEPFVPYLICQRLTSYLTAAPKAKRLFWPRKTKKMNRQQNKIIAKRDGWDSLYKKGLRARYPNEDVIRFIQKNFPEKEKRRKLKILDFGSGTGRHIIYLAKEGFNVAGFDNSPESIKFTSEWLKHEGISLDIRDANMLNLPYGNESFDVFIDIGMIEHFNQKDRQKAIEEVRRILKPGGYLFLNVKKQGDYLEKKSAPGTEENTYIINESFMQNIPCHFFSKEEMLNWLKAFQEINLNYVIISRDNMAIELHNWIAIAKK